jgi:hypothetical protein
VSIFVNYLVQNDGPIVVHVRTAVMTLVLEALICRCASLSLMAYVLSGITVDCVDPDRLAVFWGALLGRDELASLPGWRQFGARSDGVPRINFQPVPEPKSGKARLHLDVTVDDIAEAIRTVMHLGGRSLNQRHEYDEGVVVVMADPEENEFCLVQYY